MFDNNAQNSYISRETIFVERVKLSEERKKFSLYGKNDFSIH